MKFLVLLCMAGMALCTSLDKHDGSRIFDGTQVVSGDVKFIVGVEALGGFSCAGVLINSNTVLTGGWRCVPSLLPGLTTRVRFGSLKRNQGGETVGVSRKITHPDYKAFSKENDIVILKLARRITEGVQVKPIDLYNGTDIVNKDVTVAGWGSNIHDSNSGVFVEDLRKVTLTVVPDDQCVYNATISFCTAAGKSACTGDYGGPVFVTENGVDKLVGLVMQDNDCGPTLPSDFTRISTFKTWIQRYM